MAVTWEVSNTSGLGSNYKDCIENAANDHGYGSLYYATRISNDGGLHRFTVRTKKWFGLLKYEFKVYTHYDSVWKTEEPSGYSPDVSKL